jgi:hypothetical protein
VLGYAGNLEQLLEATSIFSRGHLVVFDQQLQVGAQGRKAGTIGKASLVIMRQRAPDAKESKPHYFSLPDS